MKRNRKKQRYVDGKVGRIGRPIPSYLSIVDGGSPGNGKPRSAKRLHRDEVQRSHSGRTVGVRSIQRMLAAGERTPDYRHRGLVRESAESLAKRDVERKARRKLQIAAAVARTAAINEIRRHKREQAIVRAMFRHVLQLERAGMHGVEAMEG